MNGPYHLTIRRGDLRGEMTFFEQPFGAPTPFDSACSFTIAYENGTLVSGQVDREDVCLGLDSWLAMNHWRKVEDFGVLIAASRSVLMQKVS